MKAKEFKERLANKLHDIEIIDESYGETIREPQEDDNWDRGDSSTDHNITGFRAAPEETSRYYDLIVPYEPEFDTTYYVLYAVYTTGDSFGYDSGAGIEYIGFYTKDELAVAKANLHKIETNKNTEGFSIKLKTPDGGKTFDQHTPWVGYFESLDYADITSIERQK